MSLIEALKYPFRHFNGFKLLPIAILNTIFTVLLQYAMIYEILPLVCGIMIPFLVLSVSTGGYYMHVIDRVQQNDECLEGFGLRYIGDGCLAVLSSLLHLCIPILVMFACFLSMTPMIESGQTPSLDSTILPMFLGLFFLVIPLLILLSMSYYIGIVRYRNVQLPKPLFDVSTNIKIVLSHLGISGTFLLRFLVLVMVVAFTNSIINRSVQIAFDTALSPHINITSPLLWISIAVMLLLSYTFSLIFGVSQMVLIAQYGIQLGYGEKAKQKIMPDEDQYAF